MRSFSIGLENAIPTKEFIETMEKHGFPSYIKYPEKRLTVETIPGNESFPFDIVSPTSRISCDSTGGLTWEFINVLPRTNHEEALKAISRAFNVKVEETDPWVEDEDFKTWDWNDLKHLFIDGELPEKFHKLADHIDPNWRELHDLEEKLEKESEDDDLLKALEKVSK